MEGVKVALIVSDWPRFQQYVDSRQIRETNDFTLTKAVGKNKMTALTERLAIIGKNAVVTFPEMEAHVTYISETKLKWQTVGKDGQKMSGTEEVSYKRLSDGLHFINWIEQDGFTVSQIIDSEHGTVKAYWSFADATSSTGQRSSQFVDAKFRILS